MPDVNAPLLATSTRRWFVPLAMLAIVATYGNSFSNSFHYDDFHSIVENPHIRDLENIPAFFRDPSLFSSMPERAMYRPLLLVTYVLNHSVHGYEIFGYPWSTLPFTSVARSRSTCSGSPLLAMSPQLLLVPCCSLCIRCRRRPPTT